MLLPNDEGFLRQVREYVYNNPHVAAFVSDHVSQGLKAALQDSNERAADMEVAVAVLLAKRMKGKDGIVLEKLSRWNGRSALRWDSAIRELENELYPLREVSCESDPKI